MFHTVQKMFETKKNSQKMLQKKENALYSLNSVLKQLFQQLKLLKKNC